jgi:hypothetical protein
LIDLRAGPDGPDVACSACDPTGRAGIPCRHVYNFNPEGNMAHRQTLIGPKGISAAQIAYWEDVLTKVVATGDWKKILDRYFWDGNFLRSQAFGDYLKNEFAQTRAIMTEPGLAR